MGPEAVVHTMTRSAAKKSLRNTMTTLAKTHGIKTTEDLDAHIQRNPRSNQHGPYLMSRYDALKELVGEHAADAVMHDLMVRTCF